MISTAQASQQMLDSQPMQTFSGRPTPELTITNDQGEAIPFSSFKGKVVVLNLWATWCPPCVRELPTLQQLQNEYAERGLVVITLSEDKGGVAAVAPFFQQEGIRLPIYIDTDSTIFRALSLRGLPTTFFLNRNGDFVAKLEGDTDWMRPETLHYIESLLDAPWKK